MSLKWIAILSLLLSQPAHAVALVGFVDSGLSDHLPRFQKYVVPGANSLEDSRDHGTSVVDLFLQQVEKRNIQDVEVRMESGEDSLEVARSVRTLIQAGARIINLSESFTFTSQRDFDDYRNAVDRDGKNVLFVISAGDNSERRPIDIGGPEWRLHSTRVSSDHVLVIGGLTRLPDGLTLSTNYSSRVDLMSVLIGFPALGADGQMKTRQGVSFVLPQVAAQAAELLADSPKLSPKDLIARLKDRAQKVRTIGAIRKNVRVISLD